MGKYKHKRLPMGIKIVWSLIFFQNFMPKIVQDMEYVKTYVQS
jgi:hypothetical protein